jgi:hypothetical protein
MGRLHFTSRSVRVAGAVSVAVPVADAFFLSVSIMCPNADVNLVCQAALHFSAASSLPDLSHEVLNRWRRHHSHGIYCLANVEIMKMHKNSIVHLKKPNEIEIRQSAGEKLTI